MNELITTPCYDNIYINLILDVSLYVNGVRRVHTTYEIPCPQPRNRERKYSWKIHQRYKFEFQKVFSKFNNESFKIVEILNCIEKGKPNLKLNKFIEQKEDDWFPKWTPFDCDEFFYRIKYIKVREQIISYLEQTIGLKAEVKILKELFKNNNNCDSFDDYIKRKTNYLLNINLDKWLETINNDTKDFKKQLKTKV